ADPVSAGLVASQAKPGGNMTGFTVFEYEIGAKWLELLKEIAPGLTRVGVIRDPRTTTGIGQLAAIQSAARLSRVEVIPLGGQDDKDVERTVTEFARGSNCGLIAAASPLLNNNRKLIISLAARYRLPATYPFRSFVTDGGLIGYGPDPIDQHRQAAGYVDRILKGEKPADLPVQAPTKYELAINLKTAQTGFHQSRSRLGGGVASREPRTVCNAGHRIFGRRNAGTVRDPPACIPGRPERSRI